MLSLADLVRLRTNGADQVQPIARAELNVSRDAALGTQFQAEVAAVLPGGLFRVLIQNQPFTLRLPLDAKPGDILPLVVSAREPHLKFALAAQDEPPASPARLSETARLITTLLAETKSLPAVAAAQAAAPLLPGPPADTGHVAAALQRTLAQSGIFYESHQAQWVAGERPLSHLLKEPQASLVPLRGADAGQPAGTVVAGMITASEASPAPRVADGAVHRDASAIVRQQLDTLATQHVVWNGLIWPEQSMHWEIAEQRRAPQAPAEEREWRTRLQLTLPRLGEVSATLSFARDGVSVTLHAGRDEAAATMAGNGAALRQALLDAGIAPVSVQMDGDGTR